MTTTTGSAKKRSMHINIFTKTTENFIQKPVLSGNSTE